MTRLALLLAIPLLSGCGEVESPRFVPATDASRSPTADRRSGVTAPREAPIPKNIPMH